MRQSIKFYVSTALGLAMTQAVLPQVSWAQTGGDQHDEIIVTGARISQGGAQDIKHFRGQIDIGEIPRPGGFTSEGLLCLLYTSPSPRDLSTSRMPSSA